MVHDGRWAEEQTLPGPRARSHGSGARVLRATRRGARAVQKLALATAGDYKIWLRLAIIRRKKASEAEGPRLTVDLTQNGRSVASKNIDFRDEGTPTSGVYSEHFRWHVLSARLASGALDVTLTEQSSKSHTHIDCLLVANDAAYVPDYRDFDAQLYMRLRRANDAKPANPIGIRIPAANGRLRRATLTAALGRGDVGPWTNITRWFAGSGDGRFGLKGTEPGLIEYDVEFTSDPRRKSGTTSVRVSSETAVQFVTFFDDAGEATARADFQMARDRERLVKRLPVPAFGKLPQRFPIITNLDAAGEALAAEKRTLRHVGINGFTGLLDASDIDQGFAFSRLYNSVFYFGPGGYLEPDLARIERDLQAAGRQVSQSEFASRVRHLKLIDEAQAPSLQDLEGQELSHVRFREWLRDRGYDPLSAADRLKLQRSGRNVRRSIVVTSDRDHEFPGLYYYSQRFRAHLVAAYFKTLTERVRRWYPSGILTAQNLSDGPVIFANMYAQGNDYFEYFKSGALDVALSEDWTSGAATRQLAGWNTALLRAATKYRRQPIHMYDIAHSGRRPVEVKLKALSHVAQGAKLLNMYAYAPRYSEEHAGWAEDATIIAAISELSREIGAVEDVLLDAHPVASDVAILYSTVQDIWAAGLDAAHGNERMLTYLALRHAQVPVDVLSEADVIDGRLAPYRVLYVHGEQQDRRLADHLRHWASQGGTLVLGPGAGSRDEWNRPTRTFDTALQLERDPLYRSELTLGSTNTLRRWKGSPAVVTLVPSGEPVEALFVSQRVGGTRGSTLARYTDQSAAASSSRFGAGRIVTIGFLPATAYARSSSTASGPRTPSSMPRLLDVVARAHGVKQADDTSPAVTGPEALWGVIPAVYSQALREFITTPVSNVASRPVVASHPLVESTLLTGAHGWVVALANYSVGALPTVSVRLAPMARPHGTIRSARDSALTTSVEADGSLVVTLPLESTDFLSAEWRAD